LVFGVVVGGDLAVFLCEGLRKGEKPHQASTYTVSHTLLAFLTIVSKVWFSI